MRKLFFLFFAITFSFSVQSQEGLTERAKKIADEMTLVLSLNDETSQKVYHVQLKRFIDAQRIRKTFSNDKLIMRNELRKLQNRLWGKLNVILGEEKMKSWSNHKNNI